MEENLPQPQVPVNPVPVPPAEPPPPKRFPTKWLIIIVLLAGIVLTGAYLIFFMSQSKPAEQTPQVPVQSSSQSTPNPTSDLTIGWKTYQDEKYSFQFRYPSTVYLKKSPKFPDQIFLTENDIDIEKAQEGPFALISIAIWDKGEFQKAGYPRQDNYLKSENIIVDGVNAVKVSGIIPEDQYLTGSYHQEIYFPVNDKTINFVFYENPSNNTKLLDQILSTFKFTSQTSSEGKFCGGIANIECPTGYTCKLDGSYPDAGGKCVKE